MPATPLSSLTSPAALRPPYSLTARTFGGGHGHDSIGHVKVAARPRYDSRSIVMETKTQRTAGSNKRLGHTSAKCREPYTSARVGAKAVDLGHGQRARLGALPVLADVISAGTAWSKHPQPLRFRAHPYPAETVGDE